MEDKLKQFVINVKFTRSAGKEVVFEGTTMVGFVGILHAIKDQAFGWSMDARRKGGSIPVNLLESLFASGVRTPEQHARWVFENAVTYSDAVKAFGSRSIVNPAFFIVSGTKYPEGIVLARSREGIANQWTMQEQIPVGKDGPVKLDFWTGVTNYDLDVPVPPSDDRQDPMTKNLNQLANTDFDAADIWKILSTFPTLNPHTDIQAVITPGIAGNYNVKVLYDEDPN